MAVKFQNPNFNILCKTVYFFNKMPTPTPWCSEVNKINLKQVKVAVKVKCLNSVHSKTRTWHGKKTYGQMHHTEREFGFTLKRVRDMTRTYSQMHHTNQPFQHSSVVGSVWLNGRVFAFTETSDIAPVLSKGFWYSGNNKSVDSLWNAYLIWGGIIT